jgi:hypothetical protein
VEFQGAPDASRHLAQGDPLPITHREGLDPLLAAQGVEGEGSARGQGTLSPRVEKIQRGLGDAVGVSLLIVEAASHVPDLGPEEPLIIVGAADGIGEGGVGGFEVEFQGGRAAVGGVEGRGAQGREPPFGWGGVLEGGGVPKKRGGAPFQPGTTTSKRKTTASWGWALWAEKTRRVSPSRTEAWILFRMLPLYPERLGVERGFPLPLGL